MNQNQIDEAAALLAAARTSGRPGARLPESCRPVDLESALAIQRRIVALLGHDVGGWKCSLPPAPDRINAAPILAPTIFRSSPCAIAATGTIARIEPEIAFVMADDLPRRGTPYSEADVRAAIARNAAGARTSRHALLRSGRRHLARDDGRLRAEPGSVRRAGARGRSRCAAGCLPGHDQRCKGGPVDA